VIYILDLFGVAVFAVTGSLAAGRKRLDLFGVLVVALATALGGGTLRDLILGMRPVFWLADLKYIAVGVAAATLTFILGRFRGMPKGILLTADALGLAVFTVIGADRAMSASVAPVIAIIMGVMTAVVGGMIRDILCGEIPMILRREVYATASLCGAVTFVILASLLPEQQFQPLVGIVVTLVIRLAAIRWKLSLPVFAPRGEEPSS